MTVKTKTPRRGGVLETSMVRLAFAALDQHHGQCSEAHQSERTWFGDHGGFKVIKSTCPTCSSLTISLERGIQLCLIPKSGHPSKDPGAEGIHHRSCSGPANTVICQGDDKRKVSHSGFFGHDIFQFIPVSIGKREFICIGCVEGTAFSSAHIQNICAGSPSGHHIGCEILISV